MAANHVTNINAKQQGSLQEFLQIFYPKEDLKRQKETAVVISNDSPSTELNVWLTTVLWQYSDQVFLRYPSYYHIIILSYYKLIAYFCLRIKISKLYFITSQTIKLMISSKLLIRKRFKGCHWESGINLLNAHLNLQQQPKSFKIFVSIPWT